MIESTDEILRGRQADPSFPNAPAEWTQKEAETVAALENLSLGEDHWDVLRALQLYYAQHEVEDISARELHDALDEKFHAKGGIRYVYGLFPGGPISQGCRLAGLEAPAGAADKGFGSVM